MVYKATEPPTSAENLPEYLSRETKLIENELRALRWIEPELLNGWENYAGGLHQPAKFAKLSNGLVKIHGLIASGTLATNAFILPAGYRPLRRVISIALSQGGLARVNIDANGGVQISSEFSVNNTWVSLDNILFHAEQ